MSTCPTCGAPLAAIIPPLSPRAQNSSLQPGETMESKTSDWPGGLLAQGQSTLGLPAWLCLTSMRLFIEVVLGEPK